MELLGELKDKVAKSKNREEARGIIEDAGMRLTDDELNMVAGGAGIHIAEESGRTGRHVPTGYVYPDYISEQEKEKIDAARVVF